MIKELEIDSIGSFVDTTTQINDEQEYRMWYRGQSIAIQKNRATT